MIMLDKGFSSPRRDAFPAGLRVLVVDDDPTWLKILEKMLKKCSYEVTTCGLAREALNLLRERKDGYDIVISDVNMPDMDGFKLLEHVGLEMDLPVIMMSVDGETSRVMKGVQHGACDYLLKPIRMKELRNIWQHVLRKKMHEVRDIESFESLEVLRMARNGCDQSDEGHSLSGDDLTTIRKRKDNDHKNSERDLGDCSTMKKARVVWTVDLHQKFVDAVNQIGYDKVGPKKILDLMNVPWLTRENVASHLQKYRLYLDRLQKENGQKNSCAGIKPSDSSPKDPNGNVCHQKSVELNQNDITNGNFTYSSDNVNVHNMDPRSQEGDIKGPVSDPIVEPARTFIASIPDPKSVITNVPDTCKETGMHSFAPLESEVTYSSFDSTMPTQYSWSDVSDIPYKKDNKPLVQLENGFNQLPLSSQQHHIQVDLPQSAASISSSSSATEGELPGALKNQPLYAEQGSNYVIPAETATNSLLIQSTSHLANYPSYDPIPSATLNLQNQGFPLNSIPDLELEKDTLICGSKSPVELDEEVEHNWLLNDYCTSYFGLDNIEFPRFIDPGLVAEVPVDYYDALKSDCEYLYDSTAFSLIGQGLPA